MAKKIAKAYSTETIIYDLSRIDEQTRAEIFRARNI